MDEVVKKANDMFTFINQGTEYKNWQVMLQLYRTVVRPHLEYCAQVCSPHYQKDVEDLERLERMLLEFVVWHQIVDNYWALGYRAVLTLSSLLFVFFLQWDLVCEKRSLNQAATSIFFIGVALGALLFGYLSDKYF
eukprot:g30430.t1